jgi:DNA-binding CsgD family transcriptional regulator
MTVQETSQPRLTPRELEVACLVALDKDYQEIAQRLHITIATVYFHVGNILQKLRLKSQAGIAAWYATNYAEYFEDIYKIL